MGIGEYTIICNINVQISKLLQVKVTCKWNSIIHKQLVDKLLTTYIETIQKIEDVAEKKVA